MRLLIGMLTYALIGLIALGGLRVWTRLGFKDCGDFYVKWMLWPLCLGLAPFVGGKQ